MASGSVFSETLQSITNAKLAALSNKRSTFQARHSALTSKLAEEKDQLNRVTALVAGVKQCFEIHDAGSVDSVGELHDDLQRVERFLEQAKFDSSLSDRILHEWEKIFTRHLDVQLRRYEYATLYGQLVTEWLSPEKADTNSSGPPGDVEMTEDFEELPGKKRFEAREHFEQSVFTAADVDTDAIRRHLDSLFSDDSLSPTRPIRKALDALRESTTKFEAQLAANEQFSVTVVARSIRGLLTTNLFVGERRTVLKSFQSQSIILSEIADVLNMRMTALSTWSWTTNTTDDSVPIEQRRKVNGRFDIYMHEDLLQAIFLQFIGVEWSVFFKTALGRFRRAAWKSNFRDIPRLERKKRQYYLGEQVTEDTLQRRRRRTYRKGFFLYHLLNSAEQEFETKDGEEEADLDLEGEEEGFKEEFSAGTVASVAPQAMKMKGMGGGGAMRHRRVRVAQVDDEESDDGTEEMYGAKKPMEKKQDLLHLLSTEAAINRKIHGRFSAFRSVFDDLQNALPHQAVTEVLAFFGVSKKWLGFFGTYLAAPLRFLEDDTGMKKRTRGAPASHTLSDVFSETMLFCLDFEVNLKVKGAFLYRLNDDFWFWSDDSEKTATAWSLVHKFSDTMGLPLNEPKTGSVSISTGETQVSGNLPAGRIRWGMLVLDPETLRFKVDRDVVDDHIAELQKQLKGKKSVFDWIQAWNAYAVTFFTSNFGSAANCFGRQHVDDILATHQHIQRAVFDGRDVVQRLKSLIAERFGIKDIPDGFLFFPVELGGLELQSPFVSPLQIRNSVVEHPSKILDDFAQQEREQYEELKTAFDKGQSPGVSVEVDWRPPEDSGEFMSFEEYTRYREDLTTEDADDFLVMAYDELLERPHENVIGCSKAIQQAIEALRKQSHSRGIIGDWAMMTSYWKWVAQLYGPEMVERFGGLRVVESGLLPIGMVGLFRDQKVKWQG